MILVWFRVSDIMVHNPSLTHFTLYNSALKLIVCLNVLSSGSGVVLGEKGPSSTPFRCGAGGFVGLLGAEFVVDVEEEYGS